MDDMMVRQRSVASIPSKFETVLHEGGRERDGFWNRTHRFTYTDNELPGPGTYIAPGPAEHQATSYSKKGYTGMVSKSSRFQKPRRAAAPPPGSYDPDRGFRYLTEKANVSAVAASSSFSKPIVPDEVKLLRRNRAPAPGPGQYEVSGQRKPYSAPQAGKQAPFLSGTERWGTKIRVKRRDGTFAGEDPGETPEGGQEDAPSSPDLSRITGAFSAVLNNKVPSAAFKSKTGRKFEREKAAEVTLTDLLKPHPSQGPSLGIHVDIKPGVVKPALHVPGPGAYDPHLSEQLLTLERLRHSSMFSRTTLDRFGRPIQPKTNHPVVPGPGAYDPVPTGGGGWADAVRYEASMAPFVSGTDRGVDGVRKGVAPGPAYYNPSLPGKKSFHLNVQRRWL
uniref:Sperm-tail PG-rich repeat-containing protein 2 n=1 Tax=Hemiselmis tepida TaxID=464990 RepID=A0A7S0VJH7_9CRYP|mmetsp:Transcript_19612/g.49701  ORF Transcript_19612/g.49701 Transcript_19612/m.49701 type:complete len:392 (+) Transcript_19612:35-1210(+)